MSHEEYCLLFNKDNVFIKENMDLYKTFFT